MLITMVPETKKTDRFLNPMNALAEAGVASGMRVADFGCGSGDWVLLVSRLIGADGEVCALDVQDSALSSVRSRARMDGALNVRPVRANLEIPRGTGLADNSQDVVLLSNILFQSSGKKYILEEAFRVLKPQGKVLFVDWKKEAPLGHSRELRLDAKEAQKLFKTAGFSFEKDVDAGLFHVGMIFMKGMA